MIQFQGWPKWDLQDGVLRAWWADPLIATLSFAFFINWYWYHERMAGRSSDTNFRDTGTFGLGPLYESGLAYWMGIFAWKLVVPAATTIPDGLPVTLPDLLYLLAEVVGGIVSYDALFFAIHWALHEVPCLRYYHHRHHSQPAKTLEARDTLRHSLLDGGLQVLINILVQRHNLLLWLVSCTMTVGGRHDELMWTPPHIAAKSRLARALHNIIVVWMLVESHTAAPTPYIWRRWCGGVRQHRLHHLANDGGGSSTTTTTAFQNGSHHRYQQFFGYLDDARAGWCHHRRARLGCHDKLWYSFLNTGWKYGDFAPDD